MKNQVPLLTVVVPTRNRKEMALQAIRSALEPLPFAVEVIVSDNSSEDDTPEIARIVPEALYVRRHPLLPQFDHFNLCVREAKGKYIKILCDDDWLLPGALEREVNALERDPALVAATSAVFEVDSTGKDTIALRRYADYDTALGGEELFFAMLIRENILGPPSCVTIRKSQFRGFPTTYSYAGDWAAWILLAERGAVAFLSEPGLKFRLHAANLTLRHVESGTDFLEVHALRRECCARLTGGRRFLGNFFFIWIWSYRFTRRFMRYAVRARFRDFMIFVGRVWAFKAPILHENAAVFSDPLKIRNP